MKTIITNALRLVAALAFAASLYSTWPLHAQTTATWNGAGGDGLWNNATNWDIGVPAEGTNASIAGATVTYDQPMAAGSFNALTLAGSTLNVNTNGFVLGATNGATISGSTARLFINTGGVMSVTNGGVSILGGLGAGVLASGASLTMTGAFGVGGSTTGAFTNNGGALAAGATSVNPNNASSGSSCILVINGGTNDLGATEVRRAVPSSQPALGSEGLVISNGLVRMTTLTVNRANSFGSMLVTAGTVTNTGSFIIGNQSGANSRQSRFVQLGGLVVSTDANGVRVGISNSTQVAQFSVLGGTNIAERFILGDGSNGVTGLTVNFTNAAKTYIGSGGITSNLVNTVNLALNSGGSLGANADWTGTVSMILAGGAFDASDLAGTPHNINLTNVLRGTSPLVKNGGGILTLGAANTYSGGTIINQGTLALGPAGALASSSPIIVGSGAGFDVSAVSGGFIHSAGRTLGGFGVVTGSVTAASGSIINPGSNVLTGTLTFSNSVTETGGAFNHFDLSTNPSGPNNDLVVIAGDFNVTGTNTVEITGGGGPGSAHPLIQYGGSFNGGLTNLALSGATGSLSNSPTAKTIYLIVASAIRGPTNVTWVGNSIVNDWDTINRTNWLNNGSLDYFVTGDNARFDATGATHPIVNLLGNNSPSLVTVDAAASYTFSGSGAIAGSGGLTKTNLGTLTILATNSYTGPTIIGAGALEAANLGLSGSASGIGAATADPNNLQFYGGTLRYLGTTASTDHGATLNPPGGTVDVASNNTVLTLSGVLGGSGALTKAGPGTLALTVANSYAGGSLINSGTLQINNAAAVSSAGITNNSASFRTVGALTVDNVMELNGACTLDLANAGGNTALRGAWFGSGTVTIINQDTNNRTFTMGGAGAGGGSMDAFSGTVNFGTNSGFCRINNDNSTFNFGSSSATFDVGTGTGTLHQRNGGTTTYFGALLGGPNTKVSGRGGTGASGTATYEIGGKNLSTTFAGTIQDGSSATAITKVGSGTLTLTGNSPFTGATIVNFGTLQVDGQITASPVTVSGGTLAGNGTLGGTVDIQFGGTLSPGASIGMLTISNSLTLEFGSTNIMELNAAALTNDSIVGLTSLNYGGTLIVNNLAGTLARGNSFKLFNSASYGGAFDTMILPPLTGLLFWQTNNLLVDGTLTVAYPQPTITNLAQLGTNLVMSGSGGPATSNYYVLASTNVAAPASAWTRVLTNQFDASGNFSFTDAIVPGIPQRFYLMQVP